MPRKSKYKGLTKNRIARRLYDPKRGWVSLSDIREQVVTGENVTCSKDGTDLTREVLAQVIALDIEMEFDSANPRGPTLEQLRAFIMSYSRKPPRHAEPVANAIF